MPYIRIYTNPPVILRRSPGTPLVKYAPPPLSGFSREFSSRIVRENAAVFVCAEKNSAVPLCSLYLFRGVCFFYAPSPCVFRFIILIRGEFSHFFLGSSYVWKFKYVREGCVCFFPPRVCYCRLCEFDFAFDCSLNVK